MSGEIDADVSDAYRLLSIDIEKEINLHLSQNDYGSNVSDWAVIPMITSIAQGLNPEVAKFNRKQKNAEFRLIIDHPSFLRANVTCRRNMILRVLERSVALFPKIGVKDFDVLRLSTAIEAMCKAD